MVHLTSRIRMGLRGLTWQSTGSIRVCIRSSTYMLLLLAWCLCRTPDIGSRCVSPLLSLMTFFLLLQWFATSLMMWPFCTLPHVVVTPNNKIILSPLHNCNFTTVMNHIVSIWYVGYLTWDSKGVFIHGLRNCCPIELPHCEWGLLLCPIQWHFVAFDFCLLEACFFLKENGGGVNLWRGQVERACRSRTRGDRGLSVLCERRSYF